MTITAPAEQSAARRTNALADRLIILLRRPLLLAFVLGCGVSILASGRFTLRLIVDGTLSFAFVPLCELIAYAIVYRLQRGTRQASGPASASAKATADKEAGHYARAVDRYFAGNTPWLWWMVALMAAAVVQPRCRGRWSFADDGEHRLSDVAARSPQSGSRDSRVRAPDHVERIPTLVKRRRIRRELGPLTPSFCALRP